MKKRGVLSVERYPIEQVREQFPALQRIEQDQFVAYFDRNNSTQIASNVIDAMANYMKTGVANPGGVYQTTRETAILLSQAREYVAALLGAKMENIVFGPNTTVLAYQIARHLADRWETGTGNIVITEMEQPSNRIPWITVAKDKRMRVHTLKMDKKTHTLSTTHLNNMINKSTKLVAISLASHIFGTVNHLTEIIRRAREVGALVAIDAVHVVAHQLLDFYKLDADFLFCSSNHLYGPHLGMVAMKQDLLDIAGDHSLEIAKSIQSYMETVTGTVNFEGLIGVTEAIKFIASLGEGNVIREKLHVAFQKIKHYESKLFTRLYKGLKKIKHVNILGEKNGDTHIPLLTFQVAGLDAKMVCYYLAQRNAIYVEYGHFEMEHLISQFDLEENHLIRAGISLYNTEAEVDRFIEAMNHII